MLEDAGVANLVKEGWTTDDFEKVLKALKGKGYTPGSLFSSGQGGDQGTRAFISNLYGASVTDKDVTKYTTDDPKFVKGLEKAASWIKDGLLNNGHNLMVEQISKTLQMVKHLTQSFGHQLKMVSKLNSWKQVK